PSSKQLPAESRLWPQFDSIVSGQSAESARLLKFAAYAAASLAALAANRPAIPRPMHIVGFYRGEWLPQSLDQEIVAAFLAGPWGTPRPASRPRYRICRRAARASAIGKGLRPC